MAEDFVLAARSWTPSCEKSYCNTPQNYGYETARSNLQHMNSRAFLMPLIVGVLLVPLTARADTPPAGTDVFEVIVEDQAGADGRGVFGAMTGPAHPLNEGIEVLSLRGSDDAFSSFISVRSYTTGTDYVQTSAAPASNNPVVGLDQYATVSSITGGYRTVYDIPVSSPSAESLELTVAVSVADSGEFNIAASVTNRNTFPIVAGVRFLLDIATVSDDGPAPTIGGAGGGSVEATIEPPTAELSVPPEALVITAASTPDSVVLAHWNRAFESAFDFAPDGSDVTSPGGLNDSALLYYFGATEAQGLPIAAGGTVTAGLVLAPPAQEATPTPEPTPTAQPSTTVPATASPQPSTPMATPGPGALPSTGGWLETNPGGVGLVLAGVAVAMAIIAALWWRRRRA